MPQYIKLKSVKYKGGIIKINKIKGTDWTDYEWTWKKGKHYKEGRVENATKEYALIEAKEQINKYINKWMKKNNR